MLESANQNVRTGSADGRVLHRPQLSWDALVEIYGDEATLKERIDELRAQHPEGLDDLLELAYKYLDGWRPPAWPDDD